MSLIDRCANSGTKSGSLLTTSSGIAGGGDVTGRLPTARLSAAESAVDSSATESSCSITLRQICAIFFAERFRIVWRERSAMVVLKAIETKYKGKSGIGVLASGYKLITIAAYYYADYLKCYGEIYL